MNKIAICVPTWNHPKVIEDVLDRAISNYKKYGIDVYYYDSSATDETKKIILKFKDMGYDNLHYKKIAEHIGVDVKVQMMFEGAGLEGEYDYIWPVKDRVYFPEETLELVMNAVQENHDLVILGGNNNRYVSTRTYYDAKEFYVDWAHIVTSLDIALYNNHTILEEFTVDGFQKEYVHDYNTYWCNYALIFHKLVNWTGWSIRVLCGDNIKNISSVLGTSSWTKDAFKIWKEYWVQVNDALPAYYDEYKNLIIKNVTSWPWILGSTAQIRKLHEVGALTAENCESIIKDWERVSDVPVEIVRQIANDTYDGYHDLTVINKGHGEIINILIKMSEMIRSGKMPKEQIPFAEIVSYMKSQLLAKKRYTSEEQDIIIGSIGDMENYILRQENDSESICRAMQILINFFLLLN